MVFLSVDSTNTLLILGRYWYDVALVLYLVFGFLIEAMLIEREPGFPRWWHVGWAFTDKKLSLVALFAYALTLPAPPLRDAPIEGRIFRLWVAVAITWEIAALLHAKWVMAQEKKYHQW